MDDATKDNMDELEQIGRDLLTTPLARVSKRTGMYKKAEEPDGMEPPTNEHKLEVFARFLRKELRGSALRRKKERTRYKRAFLPLLVDGSVSVVVKNSISLFTLGC